MHDTLHARLAQGKQDLAPLYQVSCGWYSGTHPGTDQTVPGRATVPTWLCTPDLAMAEHYAARLARQGYDWCDVVVSTLALEGSAVHNEAGGGTEETPCERS